MASVYGLELTRGGEKEFGNVTEYPEESTTQTFIKYDPVKLTTSGTLEDAEDSEMHLGLALAPATGVANNMIPVLRVNRDMEFSASQSNGGATQASAQTMVGLVCSWIKSTIVGHTTKITIDTSNTTDDVFEIIELDPRDPAGTTDGRVIVKFMAAKIQARQTA